jgi:carbon-monoxide dehydrogenase medium subunit
MRGQTCKFFVSAAACARLAVTTKILAATGALGIVSLFRTLFRLTECTGQARVKPPAFAYFAPRSLAEALALAAEHAEDGKLLAGGQSLMPALNFRLSSPAALVDLNRVEGLAGISAPVGGGLSIRAMTRHRAVERSAEVRERCPLLSAVMPHIAHVQIRNRGTIGGSLSHADPAAELPAVTTACDAQFVIAARGGERTVPAGEFFLGTFTTALEADEILSEIRVPQWPQGRRWAFREINRRHGDFAIAGVALWLDLDDAEPAVCKDAHIVLFGVSETPVRMIASEDYLKGRAVAEADMREAAALAEDAFDPMSDLHASAEYRREVGCVLLRRALLEAAGRGEECAA